MSEWISVNDRLPTKSGYYATHNTARPFVMWFNANAQRFDTKRAVYYWMPLPEPPE